MTDEEIKTLKAEIFDLQVEYFNVKRKIQDKITQLREEEKKKTNTN